MTEDEFNQARDDVLAALVGIRDDIGQNIWLHKGMLHREMAHQISMSDLTSVIGSLVDIDYVQINRDLKPRNSLAEFSDVKLTSSGEAFFDGGGRFALRKSYIQPKSGSQSLPDLPLTFVWSQARGARIIKALRKAEIGVMKLPPRNAEIAQAHGYIMAARILAETPDPPVATIWDLLNRANSMAGIASLLVAVVALFLAK